MTTLLDTPCSTRDRVPDRSDLSQLSAFRSDSSHERFPPALNKPQDSAFEDDEESGHITHFSPSSFKTPTKESSSPGFSELPSMPSEKSNSRGFSGECSSGGCPMFEVTDTERSTSDCSLSPNTQRIEVPNGSIVCPALLRLEDTIDSVLDKLENGSFRDSALPSSIRQSSTALNSPPPRIPLPHSAPQTTRPTNPHHPPSPRPSPCAFTSGWCPSATEGPHSFYEANGYQRFDVADSGRSHVPTYPNNTISIRPYETNPMGVRTLGMPGAMSYMSSPYSHSNDIPFFHEKYGQSTPRYPPVSAYSYPSAPRGSRNFGSPVYADYRFIHPSDQHYYCSTVPYASTPNRTRSCYSSMDEAKAYQPDSTSMVHMRSQQLYTGILPDSTPCDTPIHCDTRTATAHSLSASHCVSSKNICSRSSSPVAPPQHFTKSHSGEMYGGVPDKRGRNWDFQFTPNPKAATTATESYVNCSAAADRHLEVSVSKSALHSDTHVISTEVGCKPMFIDEGSKRRIHCAASVRGTKRRRLMASKRSTSSISSSLTENLVRSILLHNASQYLHDPVIHLPITLCSPTPTPICAQSTPRLLSNERARVLESKDGFCESHSRKYYQFPMSLRSPYFRSSEDSALCGLLTQSTAERAQYGKLINDNFLLKAVQRASIRNAHASCSSPSSPLRISSAESCELLSHLSHVERPQRDSVSPVFHVRRPQLKAAENKPSGSTTRKLNSGPDYSEFVLSSETLNATDCMTCSHCLMQILAPEDAIRWRLPDGDSRIMFCSSVCFLAYQDDVAAERRFTTVPQVPGTCVTSVASLLSDRDRSVPVILRKFSTNKWARNCGKKSLYEKVNRRRQFNQTAHVRELLGLRTTPWRWNGSRWRKFHGSMLSRRQHFQPGDMRRKSRSVNTNLGVTASCYANPPPKSGLELTHSDRRVCLLCHQVGDAVEHVAGRLLNYDFDVWLHLNCILWCYDTYETVSGSLVHVARSLKKAEKTLCSHCGRSGAGLPCFHSDCPSVYHVPCAHEIGCSFYGDRGMYCPAHNTTATTYPRLTSLAADRRVFIARDEDAQVGGIILRVNPLLDVGSFKQDISARLRVGGLILHNVGQLLPEQLSSGLYHTTNFIYPVGYSSTRIYWSYRHIGQRCRYHCRIEDSIPANEVESDSNRSSNLGAKFVVQVDEVNESIESFEDVTCDGVWQQILTRINQKRRVRRSQSLRIFQNHLIGEVLYGLTEPHIVRAIESLPGVDRLNNYAFKFGRLQLIQEMPLAINPTGCARSEPKLRTHVRRRHISDALCSQHTPLTRKPTGIHGTCTPQRSSRPGSPVYLSSSSVIQSKSQQYRRLGIEWKMNVVLARSRIQGLGLYAARDISKHTFIIEYLGELIRNEVGNRRERLYESQNRGVYMFRVDDDYIVDATMCGGLARYINHSCDPNCTAEVLTCDNSSHIIIIARRNIEKGEELTYDYKFDIEEDRWDRIPCLCGAPNCRQWMN